MQSFIDAIYDAELGSEEVKPETIRNATGKNETDRLYINSIRFIDHRTFSLFLP